MLNVEKVNAKTRLRNRRVRSLLVLDSSFSFEAITTRKLEHSVTCRDLGGFFDHVWTVHPFASLVTTTGWAKRYGRLDSHSLSPSHTFIEGKVGRFRLLRRLPALNFLIAQFGMLVYLVRLVRRQGISAVRAGDPLYNGLLGWAVSRLCGIPLVVRVGGNFDKNYEVTGLIGMPGLFRTRRIEKMFERFVLERADVVAGANQDNLDFAIANGARPERSTLFRYGNLIDRLHFTEPGSRVEGRSLLNELGLDARRLLLCISRLESVKHPDDVVRVLAEVRKRGHDVIALVVGDGQLRQSLMELARELGVEKYMTFSGNKDQKWLARIIPMAAVFVSPFTGRALSEAALGGVPIVAYDIDWQRELIESGVTGELVPHLDSAKMADAVERYLTDPDYARAMGDAIRVRAVKMMDPEELDRNERETYLALFEGGRLGKLPCAG